MSTSSQGRIDLCRAHEREYFARLRALARLQMPLSGTCPLCFVAKEREHYEAATREARGDTAKAEDTATAADKRAKLAEAEADHMNAVNVTLRKLAQEALSRGRGTYEATLRTIAGEAPS